MTQLKQYLHTRILQLEGRERTMSAYLQYPKSERGLGKAHHTKTDLLLVQNEIQETKAAIRGIEQWEGNKIKKEVCQG